MDRVLEVTTWDYFKSQVISIMGLPINYTEDDNFYEVYAGENIVWHIRLVKSSEDGIDFANNYMVLANQYSLTSNVHGQYICKTLDVSDEEEEYDLLKYYTDFSIMNTGSENIVIKFNSSDNDDIPLQGGANIRDIIDVSNFKLYKIYYKTIEENKISKLLLIAFR